jgi:hypothetical protein|tara:strand:+ start:183 stop:500 length:318 start_codon:yes stop_codon:yes gene_type:complete
MDHVKAIAYNIKQFTITEPLTKDEAFQLVTLAKDKKINVTINKHGRVIVFEANELIECTDLLSQMGLIEDIALIREITDWEISGFNKEIDIQFATHDDKGTSNDL